ncbi:unnamed protein product [Urochloa decumbens]|uniref:Serpin domain-containing protein n=1 Tax=Urochloa decumbens TaxID=240449 RepID=A0ABC8YVM8_9POAL
MCTDFNLVRSLQPCSFASFITSTILQEARHQFCNNGRRGRPSKKARRDAGGGSGLTPFALRLAKQLFEGDGGSRSNNLVFSPLSMYVALALVGAGAGGETLDEFLALLGAASRDELAEIVRGMTASALTDRSALGGPFVAFACGVWHQETTRLKPAYRTAAVESFKAETRAANFLKAEEVRGEINNWVLKATNNLITTILPEDTVHPTTALVLANAIYFNGSWSKPFDKERTEDKRFYCLDGSSVRAPFMHTKVKQFINEYDGFKVLKLPYRNSRRDDDEWPYQCERNFSMCIFLPDARDGLPGLVDKMESSSSSFLRDHLPKITVTVGELCLPKFKLSFSSQMNRTLKTMGLEAVFSKRKANLSNMLEDDNDGLYMDHVFHRAAIQVDEAGTEAAASTASTIRKKGGGRFCPTDFIADHPFVFFIVEGVSGAVVFMGLVLDPTRSE